MKFPYEIVVKWSEEDKAYIARVPELRIGVAAQAQTPEEATKRVVTAARAILRSIASEKTAQ
jgi:predicted RNase H-like HicB family nuclease